MELQPGSSSHSLRAAGRIGVVQDKPVSRKRVVDRKSLKRADVDVPPLPPISLAPRMDPHTRLLAWWCA
jgi:hypothetical protein